MHANLMHPSGLRKHTQQGIMPKRFLDEPLGLRRLAICSDGHTPRPSRMRPERRIDQALDRRWSSCDQREILLASGVMLELFAEMPLRRDTLCEHEHAARVLVEPVHHPQPGIGLALAWQPK